MADRKKAGRKRPGANDRHHRIRKGLRIVAVVCDVCECYDQCLPRRCCGYPASSLMQWRFRLINTLRAFIEERKIPDAQAAQLAGVDDELDALYEELANEQRQTGRYTRDGS